MGISDAEFGAWQNAGKRVRDIMRASLEHDAKAGAGKLARRLATRGELETVATLLLNRLEALERRLDEQGLQ